MRVFVRLGRLFGRFRLVGYVRFVRVFRLVGRYGFVGIIGFRRLTGFNGIIGRFRLGGLFGFYVLISAVAARNVIRKITVFAVLAGIFRVPTSVSVGSTTSFT